MRWSAAADGPCPACADGYRSPESPATVVSVLLAGCGLLAVAQLLTGLWGLRAYGDVPPAQVAAVYGLGDDFFMVSAVLGAVAVAVLVATGVGFLVWLHRVRRNAEWFAPDRHRLRRGWVVGAWLTPVVHLWFPWRLVADCWRGSAPLGADGVRQVLSLRPVTWWWVVWVGSQAVSVGGGVLASDRGLADLPAFRAAVLANLVADGLTVVAAVLALLLVRRLTALQVARAGAGAVGSGAGRPGAVPVGG
ncbi:DUF4328 domain-containing protein [Kitasatospora sp. NPDC054939]